jgi:hypothetical protein
MAQSLKDLLTCYAVVSAQFVGAKLIRAQLHPVANAKTFPAGDLMLDGDEDRGQGELLDRLSPLVGKYPHVAINLDQKPYEVRPAIFSGSDFDLIPATVRQLHPMAAHHVDVQITITPKPGHHFNDVSRAAWADLAAGAVEQMADWFVIKCQDLKDDKTGQVRAIHERHRMPLDDL